MRSRFLLAIFTIFIRGILRRIHNGCLHALLLRVVALPFLAPAAFRAAALAVFTFVRAPTRAQTEQIEEQPRWNTAMDQRDHIEDGIEGEQSALSALQPFWPLLGLAVASLVLITASRATTTAQTDPQKHRQREVMPQIILSHGQLADTAYRSESVANLASILIAHLLVDQESIPLLASGHCLRFRVFDAAIPAIVVDAKSFLMTAKLVMF